GLAFDSDNRLWITEASHSCRRVTSWSPDFELEQSYWGAADYGAQFGFPFTNDANRFIVHGIEFQLDPAPDIMNRPTQEKPLYFHPELAHGKRGLVYELNGHEYAMTIVDAKVEGFEICKRDPEDNVFKAAVTVTYDNTRTKDVDESRVWIDKNDNHQEDPGEVIEGNIAGKKHYWSGGWIRPDLTILTADQYIYRPTGFTDAGVPLYDFRNPERPEKIVTGLYKGDNVQVSEDGAIGTFIMDSEGNISDGVNYATADGRVGAYPNPYGRHDAPAARRGLLIAPFRTKGVVEDVPGVGSITALAGDRGEWFLMSLDGLFLASIFQDAKGEVELNEQFIGQEAFGGFLWRDEQGRVLAQIGKASFYIMEVKGLETMRKETQAIDATSEKIAEGIKIAQENRTQAYQEPETLTIAKVNRLGNLAPLPSTSVDQTLIPGADTARIQEAGDPSRWFRVAMAYDDQKLGVAFQVNDSNPWVNGEGRFTHAFIGGDAVDVKLELPERGAIRILAAPLVSGDTVAYWQVEADESENPTTYVVSNNPANAKQFDIVKRLDSARIDVNVTDGKYTAMLTVNLEDIGLTPGEVSEIKGAVGVIFSDPSGTNRTSRLYWHDKQTGMVSDVPTESHLEPANWGTIKIAR
ncbi:MAG: hypothetical protein ACQKBV_04980, partial [Puniceicoccales bacterium]